ncbi:acid protease [Trametes gibbosa]|nr:acid protease [Trametes gibbosa]
MRLRQLLPILPLFFPHAHALKFPLTPRKDNPHPYSVVQTGANTGYGFTHIFDQQYTVTLSVNGVPFQVVCDTGSVDTWVDPVPQGITPPDLIMTGKNNSATYGDGTQSSGPLVLANISLGPYNASNQAIMLSPKGSPTPDLFQGIFGLSRVSLSDTFPILANGTPYADNGRPIVHNILSALHDQPNYITFLMSRPELGANPGGVFTISELVSDLAEVTSAPRLEALTNVTWSTLLDGAYVNGVLLTGHSQVREDYENVTHLAIPEGSTIATLDTGTSYTRAPQYYVDAIFQNITGAIPTDNADGSNGFGYIVPCDTKVNVSLVFAGLQYPIHPIDMIILNTAPNGTFYCTGAFSYSNENDGIDDWLVGATFLRNVYSLFDYGWDTDPTDGQAYMQLLSVTDAERAWAEADKLLLERIVAHNAYYTSTQGVKPTTTQYAYTGTPTITVTSADDKETYAPLPSAAAPHLGEWGTSSYTTPWLQATAQPTQAQLLAGAVAESDNAVDGKRVDSLVRYSYVVIGMLAGVLALLLVVTAYVVRANRANKGYREISESTIPPVRAYADME